MVRFLCSLTHGNADFISLQKSPQRILDILPAVMSAEFCADATYRDPASEVEGACTWFV